MTLTPAQNTTLKDAIDANPTWAAFPSNSDGYLDLSNLLNELTTDYTVWKSNVTLTEIGGAIDGDEMSSLTTAESNRLQVIAAYSFDGINPSMDDKRAFYDDVFSGAGGTITRPALLALWKRFATEGEEIFATGTGTDIDPATLTFEGNLLAQDIESARNS